MELPSWLTGALYILDSCFHKYLKNKCLDVFNIYQSDMVPWFRSHSVLTAQSFYFCSLIIRAGREADKNI